MEKTIIRSSRITRIALNLTFPRLCPWACDASNANVVSICMCIHLHMYIYIHTRVLLSCTTYALQKSYGQIRLL